MTTNNLNSKITLNILMTGVCLFSNICFADNYGGITVAPAGGGIMYVGKLGSSGNTVFYDGKDEKFSNVCGGFSETENVENNNLQIAGTVSDAAGGNSSFSNSSSINNTVELKDNGNVKYSLYGGLSSTDARDNTVIINGGQVGFEVIGAKVGNGGNAINNKIVINSDLTTTKIYGATKDTHYGNGELAENKVIINANVKSDVYAVYIGYFSNNDYYEGFRDNKIIVKEKADLSGANLYGINGDKLGKNNNLIIDGWNGTVKSVNNFNGIDFKNLKWQNEGTVLEISNAADSSLASTNINLISIAGGQEINAGDYMYIVKAEGDLKINEDLVDKNFSQGIINAGVATEIDGEAFVDSDGNVQYRVNGKTITEQTGLVAENRAVAAAFINQGTDLISDSLDTLSRDGKYGVKTFAAVHGNRSKYDVNSDLKINGWSSIVGVGNEKNIGNGDLSWGVFYENGSGNYRTYNEFNNEFFRGDGSLVYNGGGIAARFEQDNGVYTEGSLRAGMLKSEMTNALKDGAGNSYGYKSESSYYGAHIGVGKIISLNEATDLDVYGKFFHTYTDGDSFTVAGDKFEFDSITSDRLRIGARLTTNKENKFSTYYGLAYEYEFNGDADMRAQNMSAPEQSLKGSSCMAEIGMNYKPSNESPWSFDLSMRGYAGQRDGFSGNVQATYTF